MAYPLKGQLNNQVLPELLLDISARSLSGLLRLSSGTTIKAIFFEEGRPVYAISNLPNEQFEHKLIKDRLATRGLIEAGKKRNENAQCLGRTLIEIGVLKEKAMQDAARALAAEIIESLFEFTQGEYGFEEGVTAVHDAVLESSAAVLERARTASKKTPSLSTAVTPPLAAEEVTRPVNQDVPAESAKPTTTRPASRGAGLRPPSGAGVRDEFPGSAGFQPAPRPPRKEASPVSAGLRPPSRPEVGRPGAEPVATGTQAPAVTTSGVSADWLMQEVTRKLNSLEGADYYQVLGVTKLASTSTINAAYERLRGMFNSYRSSVPHHEELNAKLDALFNRIKQAHDTLSDIQRRRVYDIPPGKQPSEQFVIERGRPEVTRSTPPWRDPVDGAAKDQAAKSPAAKNPSTEERRPQARAAAAGTGPAGFAPPAPEAKRLAGFEAERVAGENFQQGRTYFERRDLHAAVHMFREAVRLNDKRGDYHFQLGITLFILSQARGVHSHGEGCHVTCNLGGGLSRNQRIRREAEQHLLKAAEMDPYSAEIRVRLGMLYKDAGMVKKAQQAFHEALLLDASNVVALSEFDINADDYPEDETPKRATPPAKKKLVK
jgi:curved DNA-binding protein CbpA